MLDDSRYGPSPATGTGNSLTHILVAVLGLHSRQADFWPSTAGVRRLRRPASGDEQCWVSTPRLRARSPIASSSARGPFGKAFHVAGLPDPQLSSAVLPMPLPLQHQHPAQLAAGSRQHTPGRAVPEWMASLWRSCDFGSFVLGTAGDRPRKRSRRPGSPELRLPASRNSANQPGRHALSARAAMTLCSAGAPVLRRAIPLCRDCGYRSVAGRRNSAGRASSPQRCMSPGPSGTPVSFGA